MSDENIRVTSVELGRWILMAAFLVACLVAYFIFAPRVPPAIRTDVPVVEP